MPIQMPQYAAADQARSLAVPRQGADLWNQSTQARGQFMQQARTPGYHSQTSGQSPQHRGFMDVAQGMYQDIAGLDAARSQGYQDTGAYGRGGYGLSMGGNLSPGAVQMRAPASLTPGGGQAGMGDALASYYQGGRAGAQARGLPQGAKQQAGVGQQYEGLLEGGGVGYDPNWWKQTRETLSDRYRDTGINL